MKEEMELLGWDGMGWDEEELRVRRKGQRAQVMQARRLREETTLSLKRVAQRLHWDGWPYASNLLPVTPHISRLLAGFLLCRFGGVVAFSRWCGRMPVQNFLQMLARVNCRGVGRVAGNEDFFVGGFRQVEQLALRERGF